MKRVVLLFIANSLFALCLAQVPDKMTYQAVIRDAVGNLVKEKAVSIKLSILQNGAEGTIVYAETQNPTTNKNGLISLEIAGIDASILSGDFSAIDWSKGPYFLKTEVDPSGGVNYTISGTSQLLSVPYALHAKTAESFLEKDPLFSNSEAKNITEVDIEKLSNLSGSNTGDQDISGIAGNTQAIKDSAAQIRSDLFDGDMKNKNISNLAEPVADQDATTKAYVDALLARIEALEEVNSLELELVKNGFTDARDGIHYEVVKIGKQIWMAENLKYLPSVSGPGSGADSPLYYVYGYDGDDVNEVKATENYQTYGVLYNWRAAMEAEANSNTNPSGVQGVCPDNWHLPSLKEWTELVEFLGSADAGGKLKESGELHWNAPNTGAGNETGFTGLPGGIRTAEGTFDQIGNQGGWWSSTESWPGTVWDFHLKHEFSGGFFNNYQSQVGLSVRCIRN